MRQRSQVETKGLGSRRDPSAYREVISIRPCGGATICLAAMGAVGGDGARGECAGSIPDRGAVQAVRDPHGLRVVVAVMRVPRCRARLWDHSMDIDPAGGTGSGDGAGGSLCIDQRRKQPHPTPDLGFLAVRSPRGFGLICREFDEPGRLVYGLKLGAHGWRSAAYAASPFLIVMVRIVAHLDSMNHPAAARAGSESFRKPPKSLGRPGKTRPRSFRIYSGSGGIGLHSAACGCIRGENRTKKKTSSERIWAGLGSAPCRIRTCDRRIRSGASLALSPRPLICAV
jgi:hypothetical protein